MHRMIAFEGPDGSGKSTLMSQINTRMSERGLAVLIGRQPGGTPPARRSVRSYWTRRLSWTPSPRCTCSWPPGRRSLSNVLALP